MLFKKQNKSLSPNLNNSSRKVIGTKVLENINTNKWQELKLNRKKTIYCVTFIFHTEGNHNKLNSKIEAILRIPSTRNCSQKTRMEKVSGKKYNGTSTQKPTYEHKSPIRLRILTIQAT